MENISVKQHKDLKVEWILYFSYFSMDREVNVQSAAHSYPDFKTLKEEYRKAMEDENVIKGSICVSRKAIILDIFDPEIFDKEDSNEHVNSHDNSNTKE